VDRSESVQVFYCLFIYVLPLEIQLSRGRVRIPLSGLILPHFCVGPKQRTGFPTSYVMVFFVCSETSVNMGGDC